MASVATNPKAGKTLIVMILDSYSKYVEYGYPKDPLCYTVRVNYKTFRDLKNYVSSGIIPPLPYDEDKGTIGDFRLILDINAPDDKVIFGPEQTFITWIKE